MTLNNQQMIDPDLIESRFPVEYDDPYAEGPKYFLPPDTRPVSNQPDLQCPYGDLESARLAEMFNKSCVPRSCSSCNIQPSCDPIKVSENFGNVISRTAVETNIYENSPNIKLEDECDERDGYTDLQQDLCDLNKKSEISLKDCQSVELAQEYLREIDTGIYDAPWDLNATQKVLEEKLHVGTRLESPSSEMLEKQEDSLTILNVEKLELHETCHKCHKSLDRRPVMDNVALDLSLVQNTKNKLKETSLERNTNNSRRSSDTTPLALVVNAQTFDSRPLEDYDNPWDQKRSILDEIASEMQPSLVKPGTLQAEERTFQQSPSRYSTQIAERIDSKLPLEQQWWYHGFITRVEAENRLQSEREGSYLIRSSESNRLDYSLSVRSTRGCMHMKIVTNAEGRFILGQFSQPFYSISQMLHHYTMHKLPIKGAEHISLTVPVRR